MSMIKEEHIEVEGRVMTVLPGTMFRVELDNKHLVLATICGNGGHGGSVVIERVAS